MFESRPTWARTASRRRSARRPRPWTAWARAAERRAGAWSNPSASGYPSESLRRGRGRFAGTESDGGESRSRARRRRARRLRAGQRPAAPALQRRELRHRLALELRERPQRAPERHDGGHGDVAREAEQLLDFRFLGHGQRRDRPAVAFVARGHEDVPGERVNRGAADHADAIGERKSRRLNSSHIEKSYVDFCRNKNYE